MGSKRFQFKTMRDLLLILAITTGASVASGQTTRNIILSRDWDEGKLTLKLDDGNAEIEWITPVTFRVSRSWGAGAPASPRLAHEVILPTFEDVGQTISMKTRYITLTIDRGDMAMHVASGDTPISNSALARTADGVELRLSLKPEERVFGLMGGSPSNAIAGLNLRGQKLDRRQGFLLTSAGYGLLILSQGPWMFDLTDGVVRRADAESIDYLFYYGPTPKEIVEQHATALNVNREVKNAALDLLSPEQLPKQAMRLPYGAGSAIPSQDESPISSWDALGALVRKLTEWSISAILYPALDLAAFDQAPREVRQRAADLSAMLPIVYRTAGESGMDAQLRAKWRPYLITYLREAYDRGYPLIRPLPMQFSRDASSARQSDVFMLGDEVLLAPVITPGNKRKLDLPRGNWTDLRTNTEYRGNQTIEVDAPVGQVPMFVRNGWIVPLEIRASERQTDDIQGKMELHYFPSLGGEFFLWEPDLGENSQFHAAPAGDYVRVEIETKVRRTYEWVLHHTAAPRLVEEESGVYARVDRRDALKPGTWWHDAKLNNLHLMVRAEAGTDRIVNMSF
jgi:alpha-glucosidase (family GH31 glycosyl hydrolase)